MKKGLGLGLAIVALAAESGCTANMPIPQGYQQPHHRTAPVQVHQNTRTQMQRAIPQGGIQWKNAPADCTLPEGQYARQLGIPCVARCPNSSK